VFLGQLKLLALISRVQVGNLFKATFNGQRLSRYHGLISSLDISTRIEDHKEESEGVVLVVQFCIDITVVDHRFIIFDDRVAKGVSGNSFEVSGFIVILLEVIVGM